METGYQLQQRIIENRDRLHQRVIDKAVSEVDALLRKTAISYIVVKCNTTIYRQKIFHSIQQEQVSFYTQSLKQSSAINNIVGFH